jgi:hypothetical protein
MIAVEGVDPERLVEELDTAGAEGWRVAAIQRTGRGYMAVLVDDEGSAS